MKMAKSKKQAKKLKLRQKPQRLLGDWGHFLYQKDGVSVVYVAEANEDGSVDAALFGIDDWLHGLIICCGKNFETKESFDEFMNSRSNSIRPAKRLICQQEVAYGLRIRKYARADLPEEFSRWQYLIEPLDNVDLPKSIYKCPDCGRGLPDEQVDLLVDNVDNEQMVMYMICDKCKERRSGREGVFQISTRHRYIADALEEIEEFSVTWDQEMSTNLIRVPIPESISEAIEETIPHDGPMRAACLAIEAHIVSAASPNEVIEDNHVFEALDSIIDDRDWEDDSELEIVGFLVDAIEDGIDMYKESMRLRGSAESHLRVALREVIESVQRHKSNKDKRAYINFVKKFFPF